MRCSGANFSTGNYEISSIYRRYKILIFRWIQIKTYESIWKIFKECTGMHDAMCAASRRRIAF